MRGGELLVVARRGGRGGARAAGHVVRALLVARRAAQHFPLLAPATNETSYVNEDLISDFTSSYFAQLRDNKGEETMYESSQRDVLSVSQFQFFLICTGIL